MMKKTDETEIIPRLILRNIIGMITNDERKTLDDWINRSEENRALFNRLSDIYVLDSEYRKRAAIDARRPMEDMRHRIIWEEKKERNDRSYHVMAMAAVAAIFLILVGSVMYLYKDKVQSVATPQKILAQSPTITHGKTHAILTLDDGQKIELGADTAKNLVAITFAEEGKNIKMKNLTTPRGGEFKVTLEDGTEVWLNADSQLRYPETFDGNERRVQVSGEAYFKVAHHADNPFYVETSGQEIRVYGTEFNVNSYREDTHVYTTLVKGSIALRPVSTASAELILTPGHQAIFNKDDTHTSVHGVDTEVVTSWRSGSFVFENQDLAQIMRTLSRWYDFNYVFKEASLQNTMFMGSVPRYGDFSDVLEILEKSGGLRFRVIGKTVVISNK